MADKLLEIKDLEVLYKSGKNPVHAVNGISLTLNKGETLGLVGETGAGKTTTALAILRLLPERTGCINQGQILFEDRDLLTLSEEEMRTQIRGEKISMIFQDPMTSLNPTIKIGKQIGEAVVIHNKNYTKEQVNKKVLELMELVGISHPKERYHQYPWQFSGGMRQRCVMAIALAADPDILFADEPTTALDVTIQAQILDLLREIQMKLGTATILVSHDLGVVARVADRVAVMYAGKIVEIGTAEEVYYDPRHPYTWGLMRSLPAFANGKESLYTIPGMPPTLIDPPKGDAFACRNEYALNIDYEEMPPMFKITDTHYAATWLLDPRAPQIKSPVGGTAHE